VLDYVGMGRDLHYTSKSTLTMIGVHFTKSNFSEDKVHLSI
jgi:hypothetical protein